MFNLIRNRQTVFQQDHTPLPRRQAWTRPLAARRLHRPSVRSPSGGCEVTAQCGLNSRLPDGRRHPGLVGRVRIILETGLLGLLSAFIWLLVVSFLSPKRSRCSRIQGLCLIHALGVLSLGSWPRFPAPSRCPWRAEGLGFTGASSTRFVACGSCSPRPRNPRARDCRLQASGGLTVGTAFCWRLHTAPHAGSRTVWCEKGSKLLFPSPSKHP